MSECIVIGAGISGMHAAMLLAAQNVDVLVLEALPRIVSASRRSIALTCTKGGRTFSEHSGVGE
jgi:2-polyprenyl-6-methoxyphenol hydroxylase-like FAD-dependent oxidoreductase